MGRVVGVVPPRAALTRTVSAVAVMLAAFVLHGLSAVAYECHERPGGDDHDHESAHDQAVPSSSDEDDASGQHGDNLARCASAPCAAAVAIAADHGPVDNPRQTAVPDKAPWALTNAPSTPEPPVPKSLLLS